ncbi:MAG: adenylate/guanylate cyclase domain-containing protein, partial [Saprospiraceae bacterium]
PDGAGGVTFASAFTQIYKDSSRQMSFDSIRERPNIFRINNTQDDFDPNAVYWCKFKLRGHPEKTGEYLFQVSSDYYGERSWNNIKAFLVHADGRVETQKSGFGLKKEEKAIPFPANLLRITIAQNETAVLYFRLEGVPAERMPTFISINLVGDEAYLDMDGGYEFKGHFYRDFGYPHFVSNYILHHEIVVDTAGTMDIESVYKNWQSLDRKDYMSVKPAADQVYWLKAKFIGSPIFNGEQVIHVTNFAISDLHSFDYVDAYVPDGEGGFHHQRTGDQVPLRERPYDFWATFLKIDVPLNDTLELLVRLEGADPGLLPAKIKLTHIDESSIWPAQIDLALFEGIILGIYAVQFLYFLLLFFVEKDRIHLYLSCFVLGVFIESLFSPRNYQEFVAFSAWKDLSVQFSWISLFLIFFGLIKFILLYFDYPKSSRLSKWVIPVYFSLLALTSLFFSINQEVGNSSLNNLLLGLTVGGGVVISLLLVVTSKKREHVSKSFFLIAFLPFFMVVFISTIISIIFYENILDANSTFYNYINSNINRIDQIINKAFPLSFAFSLVMLALSAGKRTNALKEEKEKALQKNLEDQQQRLAEQQRVNKAISRFVPNEFLHALGKSDITEIALGDTVEKEVTVFFSDIRDYTALSEQMSPEENFKFVNAYNGRMGPIIQNNDGFVNQYLGDGIMAIFPNTPADALRAAIQMQQGLQSYNQQRMTAGRSVIKVGMGLHTGSLIMGITGDENRMDAATISDSVNSAARIESLSKYYGTSILLSEVTLKKIDRRDEFHFRYLGKVQVKGKQKPLKIYECFDGDLPEIVGLKLTTLAEFNTGIKHYFSQLFSQAILDFENVIQQNPKDKTAKLFLHKAKQLTEMGVSENWTGVELMGQK